MYYDYDDLDPAEIMLKISDKVDNVIDDLRSVIKEYMLEDLYEISNDLYVCGKRFREEEKKNDNDSA